MRNFVLTILLVLFIALGLVGRPGHAAPATRVVARVNGEAIAYSDIRATPDRVNSAFEKNYGRAPTDLDDVTLRSLRMKIEAARLEAMLRQEIRDAELTRLGVLPSDAEIQARCDRDYPPDERRARGEEVRRVTRVILRAYERVFVDGDAPEDVYAELLNGYMTREEWQLRVKHDVTEKSIRNMHGALDRSAEELFNCRSLMLQLIPMERKGAALDQEIARTDPAYAEYLRIAAENPRSQTLRDKGPMYREARRYKWWQERFETADIVILDPKYATVLRAFRKEK